MLFKDQIISEEKWIKTLQNGIHHGCNVIMNIWDS